jgi:hypothetical protein
MKISSFAPSVVTASGHRATATPPTPASQARSGLLKMPENGILDNVTEEVFLNYFKTKSGNRNYNIIKSSLRVLVKAFQNLENSHRILNSRNFEIVYNHPNLSETNTTLSALTSNSTAATARKFSNTLDVFGVLLHIREVVEKLGKNE